MEIKLDESTLDVLKNIFEWTDLDGDGIISWEDLKVSTGLETDIEVDNIFNALKTAGRGNADNTEITYENFCRGIMDFPFLIERFKNEFLVKPLEIDVGAAEQEKEYNMETVEFQRDTELNFIIPGLQDAIILYSQILDNNEKKITYSNNREDLLESLRMSLEKLKVKFRTEGDIRKLLVNGSIELYLLVRDISRYHEEICSDFKAELYDKDKVIEGLKEKCDELAMKNERLYHELETIENKAMKTIDAHTGILQEKIYLQQKLEEAESQELYFKKVVKNIEEIICNKEREISQLEKDLRQLNSLKAIQLIRESVGRSPEDMKKRRQQISNYRQSVPIRKCNSPTNRKLTIPTTPKNDFRHQMLTNQIKFKDERAKKAENDYNELEIKIIKYEIEIEKLSNENKALIDKLQLCRLEINRSTIDNRESLMIPSLFDELMLIRDGSTVESHMGGSVYIDVRVKTSEKGIQNTAEKTDRRTQTKTFDGSSGTQRSCFSWFNF